MLSCKQVANRASALIDGDLSMWDGLQLRLHLAKCKGCRRVIEQMRAMDRLAAQAGELDRSSSHAADSGPFPEILSMLGREHQRRSNPAHQDAKTMNGVALERVAFSGTIAARG